MISIAENKFNNQKAKESAIEYTPWRTGLVSPFSNQTVVGDVFAGS